MTNQTAWTPAAIDATRPSPARVYDAWLGGKDNYAIDRAAAAHVALRHPGVIPAVRANRGYLVHAVRRIAAGHGIDQFLDIGAGLPTSPNVHEIAQTAHPDARVVYVDNDPIVLVHARAIMATGGHPAQVHVLDGDLTRPGDILAQVIDEQLLDLSRPVGLLLVAVLHFVPSDLAAQAAVGTLVDRLAPGSHVVITHTWAERDGAGRDVREAAARYAASTAPFQVRTRAEIEVLFDGLEIMPPGLTQLHYRRMPVTCLAGIARKS